jgi:4a-hydroxytetrahydrobiopterin dehydratase
MSLADRSCAPCAPGTPPLGVDARAHLAKGVPLWQEDAERLTRTFRFGGFPEAIRFVDDLAKIAEAEQHHPDVAIHYDRVRIDLSTHSIGGLSENDYILAAKIDRLAHRLESGR